MARSRELPEGPRCSCVGGISPALCCREQRRIIWIPWSNIFLKWTVFIGEKCLVTRHTSIFFNIAYLIKSMNMSRDRWGAILFLRRSFSDYYCVERRVGPWRQLYCKYKVISVCGTRASISVHFSWEIIVKYQNIFKLQYNIVKFW